MRTFRRLTRFWIAATILSVLCCFAFFLSTLNYLFLAPFSASFGANTPFYLLSYIDPTYFLCFQIVTLFFLYDSQHRHQRVHLDQVLDSKPPTIFEYLTGRVLGVSILVWMIASGNLLLMYLAGILSKLSGLDFTELFQFHSLVNLVVIDIPTMLIFWASLTVFLATLLRYRVLVLAFGLAFMLVWFYFIHQLPFSLYGLVSASSNDTLFVSDLIPEFISWTTLLVRLASLIFALSLLIWANNLSRRSESSKKSMQIVYASCLLILSCLIFGLTTISTLSNHSQVATWLQFHENTRWDHELDILAITGTLNIDPNRELSCALQYRFRVLGKPMSDNLLFSLNPGLKVERVQLKNENAEFSFENGLLTVQLPNVLELNTEYFLQISFRGVPNPRFAYLDQEFDYLNDRSIYHNTPKIFGTRGSVYHSQYVALMPGVYWYPKPGAVRKTRDPLKQIRDFFDVELRVSLTAKEWKLIATSETSEIATGEYEVESEFPTQELGLFASNFQSKSVEIAGLQFSVYTHTKHDRNLQLFDALDDDRRNALEELVVNHLGNGVAIPSTSLSFVEIPRQLRTVGGGWRMQSTQSLPGIILMKEHGFPRSNLRKNLARLDLARNVTDSERRQSEIQAIKNFFESGVSTDSLRANLVLQSWHFLTSAIGENAVVLDNVVSNLIGLLNWESTYYSPFSVHSSTKIAPQLAIHGDSAFWGLEGRIEGENAYWVLRQFTENERTFGNAVRNKMLTENVALADTPTSNGSQFDLEHLLYKSAQITFAIFILNDRTALTQWIAEMQQDFRGRHYTFDELKEYAREHNIIVEPFLTDWIANGRAPGVVASGATTIRIADDDNGQPQYQTSLNVRNLESTAGLVSFTDRTYIEGNPRWRRFNTTVIPNNSAVTVNIVHDEIFAELWLQPYYSLNENIVPLELQFDVERIEPQVAPKPPIEQSTWQPTLPEGVIVDNLDKGFSVPNQEVVSRKYRKLGPNFWFPSNIDGDAGVYRNMLVVDLGEYVYIRPKNQWYLFRAPWWYRNGYQYDPYGKYEFNIAEARANDSKNRARFAAEIPESGVWNLEYHWPWGENRTEQISGNGSWKFQVYILNDAATSEVEVDLLDLEPGWNEIGTFELQGGETAVEVGTKVVKEIRGLRINYVYADAIRWLKDSDN